MLDTLVKWIEAHVDFLDRFQVDALELLHDRADRAGGTASGPAKIDRHRELATRSSAAITHFRNLPCVCRLLLPTPTLEMSLLVARWRVGGTCAMGTVDKN